MSQEDTINQKDRADRQGDHGLEVPGDTNQGILERLLDRETAADRAVSYLSVELDRMKRQQHQSHIRPLLQDLLLILDRQEAVLKRATDPAVESFHAELTEALARFEVVVMRATPDTFDGSVHTPVACEQTTGPADHLKVLRRVRCGYTHQGQVLRPEEVIIARYQDPAPQGRQTRNKES